MKQKKLTIPQIRQEMKNMAAGLADAHKLYGHATYLNFLADQTKRTYIKKRAPDSSRKITPSLKRAILATYRAHPRWSVQKIANKHKTNQGRVSEIIGGKK